MRNREKVCLLLSERFCSQRPGESPTWGPCVVDGHVPLSSTLALERDGYLQVVVKALDPSKTEYSISDIDSVNLTRKLALGLQKSSSYVEGAADTIEYSFEVSKPESVPTAP